MKRSKDILGNAIWLAENQVEQILNAVSTRTFCLCNNLNISNLKVLEPVTFIYFSSMKNYLRQLVIWNARDLSPNCLNKVLFLLVCVNRTRPDDYRNLNLSFLFSENNVGLIRDSGGFGTRIVVFTFSNTTVCNGFLKALTRPTSSASRHGTFRHAKPICRESPTFSVVSTAAPVGFGSVLQSVSKQPCLSSWGKKPNVSCWSKIPSSDSPNKIYNLRHMNVGSYRISLDQINNPW